MRRRGEMRSGRRGDEEEDLGEKTRERGQFLGRTSFVTRVRSNSSSLPSLFSPTTSPLSLIPLLPFFPLCFSSLIGLSSVFSSPHLSFSPLFSHSSGGRCTENEETRTWTVSLDWTTQQRREGM